MKKRKPVRTPEEQALSELKEQMGEDVELISCNQPKIWKPKDPGESISGLIIAVRDIVLNKRDRKNILIETARGRMLLDVSLSDKVLEQGAEKGYGVLIRFKGLARGPGRNSLEYRDYNISLLRNKHKKIS